MLSKFTKLLPSRPDQWSDLRHLPAQTAMLKAIGRTALLALRQKSKASDSPVLPGPTLTEHVSPRPQSLIDAYLEHLGADKARWHGQLPPHFFAQWGFPLIQRTLESLPYPTIELLNAGAKLDIRKPIPSDEALSLSARLLSIDDDGRNVVLTTELITSTQSAPDALRVEFRAVWRHPRKETKASHKPKETPLALGANAHTLKQWTLSPNSGLQFALLTGDFNPIHWIPFAARMSGFKFTILHGFDSLGRIYEGLLDQGFNPKVLDVNFTRPLLLPKHHKGLTLSAWLHEGALTVGASHDGPFYLRGTLLETSESAS